MVQGIDVRKNFIIALEAMEKRKFRFIDLSGDLSDDGNIGAYEFVSQEMSQYKKPWCFIRETMIMYI